MSQSETEDRNPTGTGVPIWSGENRSLIALFTALSTVGLVLSTGILNLGLVPADPGEASSDSVQIPFFYLPLRVARRARVYLYETNDQHGPVRRPIGTPAPRRTRAPHPAAWVLGAGTYLLSAALLPPSAPETARFTAGSAFLVGLYVNVALKSLGGFADRMLGRGSKSRSRSD